MIQELANGAQFILQAALYQPWKSSVSQFYGYKFRNKVFCVECVTREDPFDFVQDNTPHR